MDYIDYTKLIGGIDVLRKLTPELYERMKNNDMFDIRYEDLAWNYELPEDIIREFENKLNWLCISRYQKISYEFIIEFIERITLYFLKRNPNLNLTKEQLITIHNLKEMYKY